MPKTNRGRAGSALHNFGHSFVSLMNWYDDGYVMSNLVRQAIRTRTNWLTFDILGERAEPFELLTPAVLHSIEEYRSWFPKLLQTHRIPIDNVVEATLRLGFDFKHVRPAIARPVDRQVPFLCVVTMRDFNGHLHRGRIKGAWVLDP